MLRPFILTLAACAFCGPNIQTASAAEPAQPEKPAVKAMVKPPHKEAVFAVVGGVSISQHEYDNAFAAAKRQKFYHGQAPEAEVAALQREVGNNLVNSVLLTAEARKRAIKPDTQAVRQMIEGYETRYKASEQWQRERTRLVPELTRKLEDDSLIRQLESSVRNVPMPGAEATRAFYEQHGEKFTEPEQVHVSVILLKVDPSSPTAVWQKAEEEGKSLIKQLRSGAKFADVAKLRSSDESAQKGGDMGYLHRGMLPEAAQQAVDQLKQGELSEVVRLLEGVALFRLEARKLPRKVPFAEASERAAGLLQRELSEKSWLELIARLRKETPVRMDESRFSPLAVASGKAVSHP